MKTLSKNLTGKVLVVGFLLAMVFTGGECPSPSLEDTAVKFTVAQSQTNHLEWTFTNQSINADTYKWEFGDGGTSDSKNITHTYAEPKSYPVTFIVKLTASKGTVTYSVTYNVIINSPNIVTGADLLYGENGVAKTWKLAQVEASLEVMSQDRLNQWWKITQSDFPMRKCLFDFEYIFRKEGNQFQFKHNGEMWVEEKSKNLLTSGDEGCIPIDKLTTNEDGDNVSAWAGRDDYTYQWTDASGNVKAKLALQGLGTFLGLPKISGDGTSEADKPASRTVYTVEKIVNGGTEPDTLVLNYDVSGEGNTWLITLVSYKSAEQEPKIGEANPLASFTVEEDNSNYLRYTFTNTSQFATSYSWDFGDGGTSNEESPTHTYASTGDFTVTLIATGAASTTPNTVARVITVASFVTTDAAQDLDPSDGTFALTFASGVPFNAFDGAAFASVNNPSVNEPNTSVKVGKITNAGNKGGEGASVDLNAKFDFTTKTMIILSVYSPIKGAVIRLRLEDKTDDKIFKKIDNTTTVANTWETMAFEFEATDNNKFDKLIVLAGFETVSPKTKLTGSQIFYFDNIRLVSSNSDAPAKKGNRNLVWNDEFPVKLDLSKWEAQIGDGSRYGIPGWGNNEEQYYLQQNATVKDGKLVITALSKQTGGKKYTSARLRTLNKGDWKHGWFEARIKLPASEQGIWPAFWMLPSNASKGWPASGEIDIMEWIARDKYKVHGTIHYGESKHEQKSHTSQSSTSFENTWHVYAIEWTKDSIKWFIDDVQYAVVTRSQTSSWPFDSNNFHILINLAVGGNWPGFTDATTTLPQTLEVDYVRVYQ